MILRLIGAVLLEQNDEWQLQHRYMQVEGMAGLIPPTIDGEATPLPSAQITPQAARSKATQSTTKLHQLDGHYPLVFMGSDFGQLFGPAPGSGLRWAEAA